MRSLIAPGICQEVRTMKRIGALALAALAVFVMALSIVPKARAQDAAQDISQDPGPKQPIRIHYGAGVILEGKGDDAVKYKGLIYLKIFPVSARLIKKYGAGPAYSNEIHPTSGGMGVSDEVASPSLPLGKYEVHFSMREGDTIRTCIKRDVLLTANGEANVEVEMSGTTQTLIIGGDDMSAQQMRDSILQLKQQVAALQAEVAVLKATTK